MLIPEFYRLVGKLVSGFLLFRERYFLSFSFFTSCIHSRIVFDAHIPILPRETK